MEKKVMFADDEEEVLELVSATLGDKSRFNILLARDGTETLEIARRERPNLLFLDILMPKINGYEVCRRLKYDPATASITVVMLTALNREDERCKGIEMGADDYFTKPFSPTALLNKVDEVLGVE